jgi:ankyrin repeat protein
MDLCAQEEEQYIDTSQYVQSDSKDAKNFNLLVAASKGYDLEIERLVGEGADINTTSGEGVTPLVYAVAFGHLSTVKTIISLNPDINKMTYRYETPLLVAVKNNNPEIAELLIRNGADINRSDGNGASAIHFAALYGFLTLTDMLLYYDADCNGKSADGTSPLMAAIWAGNADIADLLVQNGANMEARDDDGFTPFLIASQNGDTLLMNFLLQKGIDLYEKNNKNFNALDLAIANSHKEAVTLLLGKGDQWTSSEKAGLNPYRIAYDFNRRDFIKIMEQKNIPGETRKRINQTDISIGEKFTFRDIYTGLKISMKEPVLNGGIFAGCDLKLWYTRVLVKASEDTYYQYYNRNSIVYAGVFKELPIFESQSRLRISGSGSLSLAYLFGNIFKGTNFKPDSRIKIIPSVELKIQKERIAFTSGIEYMTPEFYKVGSIWGRAGVTLSFFADKITSPAKVIKWR